MEIAGPEKVALLGGNALLDVYLHLKASNSLGPEITRRLLLKRVKGQNLTLAWMTIHA